MNKQNDTGITPELLEQAKAKDKEALSRLYEKTQLDIYRTVHAMIRDEDLTLDIQQDTYLKAFSRLDQLRDAASFLPWLRQIAVNEARAQLTKKRPMAFSELSDGDEEDTLFSELPDLRPDASPEMTLDRKETNRLIREILDGLSDGQRLLLGMFYYERIPLRRIAEDTGLSVGTVKAQLHRGRKRVETEVKKLEAQGIKLYGLSPVAFLLALMRRAEPTVAESARQAAVKAAVTKVSADAVASTAVPVAAKTFGQVLTGRLLAGALAVALIGGGIWGGAKLLKSQQRDNPYRPTTVETNERLSGVETPEEISETNEDLPVITDPAVTEPTVTEPAETQPAATEPAVTEPSGTDPAVTEPSGAEPAQPVRADNQCGEHLTWRFEFGYEYGNLIFEGSGPMDDYADPQDAPWYSHRSEITGINLPNGLTAIGDNAFAGCTALNYVRLPDTLTSIGRSAFQGCTSMESLSFRTSLTEIGENAFSGCTALSWCPLPDSLTSLGSGAFTGCDSLQTLQIFNPACVIGSGALVSPQTKLVGFPGSTAEQNAAKNGYDFEAISEVDESMLRDLLNQSKLLSITEESYVAENGQVVEYSAYDKYHPVVFSGGIYRIGDRCLMKLIYSPFVTVPAAEMEQMLAQARQTGTLDLNGETWIYTESADQVKELVDAAIYPESDHGWIVLESGEAAFAIQPIGDTYVFRYSFFGLSGYMRGDSSKELGWLWLDADTPVTQWRETTYPATLGNWFGYTWAEAPRDDYWSLELGDDGNYVANTNTAGKK